MPSVMAASAAMSTLREAPTWSPGATLTASGGPEKKTRVAERHHDRERDREIIGVALLEAERARLEAEPVLEEPGARDGHRADKRDGQRRCRDRAGPDHVRRHRAHARITIVKKTT